MPPLDMRNGGSAGQPNTPATAKIRTAAKQPDSGQPSAIPRVRGRLLVPSGRRGLPALIVQCPLPGCGGVHLHRGGGGVRRAGCGRGDYLVIAVQGVSQGRAAA